MITWDEAAMLTAEKIPTPPDIPLKNKIYYAYKGGNCTPYPSYEEAVKHSKLIEPVIQNQDDIDRIKSLHKIFDDAVLNTWIETLQQEYPDLVKCGIFDQVYSRAYEIGHSYGMDSVANEMEVLDEFLDDVLPIYTDYIRGQDNNKKPQ